MIKHVHGEVIDEAIRGRRVVILFLSTISTACPCPKMWCIMQLKIANIRSRTIPKNFKKVGLSKSTHEFLAFKREREFCLQWSNMWKGELRVWLIILARLLLVGVELEVKQVLLKVAQVGVY